MVGDLMRETNNYFEDVGGPITCQWHVAGQLLTSSDDIVIRAGWIAIHGSACHDGVWRIADGVLCGADDLPEESFYGDVWQLYPPAAFLRLAEDVARFEAERPSAPVSSESFGMYSHTFLTGSAGVLTWQEAFASRLRPYRRMFTEVSV